MLKMFSHTVHVFVLTDFFLYLAIAETIVYTYFSIKIVNWRDLPSSCVGCVCEL